MSGYRHFGVKTRLLASPWEPTFRPSYTPAHSTVIQYGLRSTCFRGSLSLRRIIPSFRSFDVQETGVTICIIFPSFHSLDFTTQLVQDDGRTFSVKRYASNASSPDGSNPMHAVRRLLPKLAKRLFRDSTHQLAGTAGGSVERTARGGSPSPGGSVVDGEVVTGGLVGGGILGGGRVGSGIVRDGCAFLIRLILLSSVPRFLTSLLPSDTPKIDA
jgi:hypothetical protein